jgi:hypothetical protein
MDAPSLCILLYFSEEDITTRPSEAIYLIELNNSLRDESKGPYPEAALLSCQILLLGAQDSSFLSM